MENSAQNIQYPTTFDRIIMDQVPILGSAMKQQYAEEREDNAVQRKMTDMKKAGLNPILAYQQIGGGASSQTASNSALQTSAEQQMYIQKKIAKQKEDVLNSAAKVLSILLK